MCGTINPTKPIGPAIDTDQPANITTNKPNINLTT